MKIPNDYVFWAACGLGFGGKHLTRVSCQRLQNVSLSVRWKNVGKKAPGSRSTRYNGLLRRQKKVGIKLKRV